MNEDLLYYIWQQKLFDHTELRSTEGEALTIVHPGVRNHDSGPDFTQARVRVDDDLLVGNVEIHVNASDWKKHRHHIDKAYSNVVLHVVYQNDTQNGSFPTLELREKINTELLHRYNQLMLSRSWIPCEKQIGQLDALFIKSGLHRLLIERMEQKTHDIAERHVKNRNSWEETCYQTTAKYFGLKANAIAFELLAQSLPLRVIAKHKNSLLQIEALLFGQAGFLQDDFKDDYPNQLKKEYQFLQKKYELKPLEAHLWKFMRMRPAAFPTIRIAQFAKLLYRSSHLFSKLMESKNIKQIMELLEAEPSEYWLTHYRFDAPSVNKKKLPGSDFLHTIIINAFVPLLFIYGKSKGDVGCQDKALSLLEELPAEENSIIERWKSLGIACNSAYESQALLQLKNGSCSHKQCLKCYVGNRLLKG